MTEPSTRKLWVKLHLPTGIVEGCLMEYQLQDLQQRFNEQSSDIFGVTLREGSRYDSPSNHLLIKPIDLIAIESRDVRDF